MVMPIMPLIGTTSVWRASVILFVTKMSTNRQKIIKVIHGAMHCISFSCEAIPLHVVIVRCNGSG